MVTKLSLITTGKVGIIKEITTDHVTKERLESLGLITGVEITSIRKLPLGRIRIYKCLNTLVALRKDIADGILVEVPNE
jgi:Fe2+ transport system protein FeoA